MNLANLAPRVPVAVTAMAAARPAPSVGKDAPETDAQHAPTSISGYYASAQGTQGVALLRELHDLSERHHHPFSYTAARRLMFRSIEDPGDADVITELYSGAKVRGITGLRTATEAGLTTEHVWPQSEGATEDAKSDLHHLRPADGRLNTHRSNLPFGEVTNVEWASAPVRGVGELSVVGTSTDGTRVFEPRMSMRGDLARDQLYFFTRYFGDQPADFSLRNFRTSLPTLLRWHREDPVDDTERARNDAIFALQGNRNPFIDRPGFVDRIDFADRLTRP